MKQFLLLAIVLLTASCSKLEQRQQRPPVSVRVFSVSSVNHAAQRTYVGTVKAYKEVSLSAKFPGTVSAVNVAQGDYVPQNTVVLEVHSQTVKSTYDMAAATLAQAEDGYDRLMQVKKTNSVPDIKVVEIETKLEQARAQYRAASQTLEDCRLKAPFAGVVASVDVEKDIDVQPLQQLVKIFDISSLEVHISVPETEIGHYTVGDSATIVVPALNDRKLHAVLHKKGIEASSVSHSYDCIFKVVGRSDGLMPGMVTKVYVDDDDVASIVIPSAVIKLDDKGKYVWVVEDGVVGKRYISLGEFSGRGVIVTEGLSIGDSVITDGSQKVSIGTRVNIVD